MKTINKYIFYCIGTMLMSLMIFSCEETVKVGPYPDAVIITSDLDGLKRGDFVTFDADIEGFEADSTMLYTWQFMGGDPSYSNSKSVTVEYKSGGHFPVILTVRNANGGNEIVSDSLIYIYAPPIVDITTEAQVRLAFDQNLDNTGLVGIPATVDERVEGGPKYSTRPADDLYAYDFDQNNCLVIKGYKGISGAADRSVAAWVKTTEAANKGIVHWGGSATAARVSFKLKNTGGARLEWAGGGLNSAALINDGEWHHIAYTYSEATHMVQLYVDGIPDVSIEKVLNTADTDDVCIGSQNAGAKAKLEGSLDDVRIFDVVLSAEDILTLSNMK